ncbi:DUF6493 family protein [Micromonospora sonneratiae]|uniref:DUF6493 family protein n=1 Tax=Micromonospora sonneratiae TaxID=1184706 RepID=A0ABW3Y6E7_9ACTN
MITPPLTWPTLKERIERDDLRGIVRLVSNATDEQRTAVAKEIEAYVRTVPADKWWSRGANPAGGVGLAAIGCLPSAARVAALLCRRGPRDEWNRIPARLFIQVAQARQVPWLGDLAVRLTGKLRTEGRAGEWHFVVALLTESGATPPMSEGFVRGWLEDRHRFRDDRSVANLTARLRDDPFLDLVLPALFEIDRIGSDFAQGGWDNARRTWDDTPVLPATLVALAEEGRLDRKILLDGCVGRFLRGDRPGALRSFILLYEALAPTTEELADRALDYAQLLPAAPAALAGHAQRALRTVDDAGRLELETMLDVSRETLLRREKGLVKTQLGWLDRVARRHPDRVGEVLDVVAVAFGHDALDIQDRALAVVAKHFARLDGPVPAGLLDAAGALGGDLPARAAQLFGMTPSGSTSGAGPDPVPVVPAPAPAAMPPSIASAAELAEEISALLNGGENAVAWERILAGVVSLAAVDRAGLADAMNPLLDRYAGRFTTRSWGHQLRIVWLGEAIRSAISGERREGIFERMVSSVREAWQGRRNRHAGVPDTPNGVLALRIAEISALLHRTSVPFLVATPTSVNGSLAVEVLVDRISRAEADGWQPWPLDLEQALLRLPREVDPEMVTRAGALTSPAGVRLARWLTTGGVPDPVATRVEQRPRASRSPTYWGSDAPARRVVVSLRPDGDPYGRFDLHLFTLPRSEVPTFAPTFADDTWPATLPHHREAIAAWALPGLASLADSDQRGGAEALPLLAECSGPVGSAMSLALVYGLGARHESDRVAAVDALLLLAGSGSSATDGIGRELGDLGVDGTVKLTRVVPGLADAARAGAGAAVWQVISAALPMLLPAAPRGLPDLLALGAQVVPTLGVGEFAGISALAEVAGRSGSSRLVTEARRLHRLLAP